LQKASKAKPELKYRNRYF